jgi:hypothetical protein
MKRFPTKSLVYWCILAVEAINKIKKIAQKGAFTSKDWHEMLPLPYMGIVLQYAFQQGQPPLLPPIYNMEVVLPVEVEVPSVGVLLNSKVEL